MVLVTPLLCILLDALHAVTTGIPLTRLYLPWGAWLAVGILAAAVSYAILTGLLRRWLRLDLLVAWPILLVVLLRWLAGPFKPYATSTILPLGAALLLSAGAVLICRRRHTPPRFQAFLHLAAPGLLFLPRLDSPSLMLVALCLPVIILFLPRPALRLTGGLLILALAAGLTTTYVRLSRAPVVVEEISDLAADLDAPPAQSRGNVILIVLDTARKDAIDITSTSSRTPHLQRLARQGYWLDHFLANSPWTPPSHASIFTGRYPPRHGVTHDAAAGPGEVRSTPLGEDQTTLAEMLRARGVQTSGFIANAYLRPEFGFHQGFDEYFYVGPALPPLSIRIFEKNLARALKIYPERRRLRELYHYNHNTVALSGDVFAQAEAWLRQRACEPFFLFINVMDQHYIRHCPDPRGAGHLVGPKYYWEPREELMLTPARFAARNEALRAWHNTTMAYLDQSLGAFFLTLRTMRLFEETTVIVTSDHGNLFGEYGHYDHQTSVYDHNVDVPFVIKYADEHAARRPAEGRIFQQVDLCAEILDLFGVPLPPTCEGVPFPERGGSRPLTFLYRAPGIPPRLEGLLDRDLCATILPIDGDLAQLIYASDGHHEIYRLGPDLRAARGDRWALWRDRPAVAAFLAEASELLLRLPRPDAGPKIDAATRERLRGLGYIQ